MRLGLHEFSWVWAYWVAPKLTERVIRGFFRSIPEQNIGGCEFFLGFIVGRLVIARRHYTRLFDLWVGKDSSDPA